MENDIINIDIVKKAILLILPLIIIYFLGTKILISACDTPIHYRIDIVDPKFNLSKDQFTIDTKKAADIWNKAYGKDLFVYDPRASLSINLIYDQRQFLDSQITNLESQLNNLKGTLDPQIAQYQTDLANFKAKLADLNNQIDSWNKKGGAPPDVYNQLLQEQKSLQAEADRLNVEAKSLNLTTQNFNVQVGNFNNQVNVFNEALTQRPEEGIYIGDTNRIEIYFDITYNELIHTLTHELGHARGLPHTSNPVSIMYPKTNDVIIPAKEDLSELNMVCAKKSLFETILGKKL